MKEKVNFNRNEPDNRLGKRPSVRGRSCRSSILGWYQHFSPNDGISISTKWRDYGVSNYLIADGSPNALQDQAVSSSSVPRISKYDQTMVE